MKIPFSPPFIDDDVKQEVADTLNSGWITTGPKVKQLQDEVAAFCRVEAALGVNSATSGMMLVLHWLGVTRGDEVIIPAYTYCATALAVMHLGAVPVMVDIQEDFTISVAAIEAAITTKTKAIITVDFGGWPCAYDDIYATIQQPSVKNKFSASGTVQQQLGRIMILADAAHSLGASYKGLPSGSLADITVFSFHAVKNITTAEGGLICLNMPAPFNNQAIYQTLRLWSLNGQTKDAFTKTQSSSWKYDIVYPGFKMNLPDVLAAIGLAQFRKYNTQLLADRKRIFDTYHTLFEKQTWALRPPFIQQDITSSYHLYPLRINGISEEQRDRVMDIVLGQGIGVNVHFIPLPLLTLFKEKGYNIQHYPVAYHQYAGEISLPIYPQLSEEDCYAVAYAVINAVEQVIAI